MPAARAFYLLAAATLLLVGSVVAPTLSAWAAAIDVTLLLLFLVDLRRARATSVSATRKWPPMLFQGQPATLEIELHNRTRRALRIALREGLAPALASSPARAEMLIGPLAAGRWEIRLEPRRRGDHRTGPLTARLLGPWKLAWSQRQLLAGERRSVYPRIRWGGSVGRLLVLAHRRQIGRMPQRQQGTGGEIYGLREYLPGDPLNQLHWKATARHARPISREESWERGLRLLILLDTARSMATEYDGRSNLDHALAASLALGRVAAARGDQVTLAAFSNRLRREVVIGSGPRDVSRAYTRLYDLQAELTNPAYELAAEYALRHGGRGVIVVLMSSIADVVVTEIVRDCLLRVRRRHRPILINLIDARLAQLLDEPARDAATAFARLSALEISLANQRLAERLRRSGVRLVNSRADRLGISTLSSYLECLGLSSRTLKRLHHGGSESGTATTAPASALR